MHGYPQLFRTMLLAYITGFSALILGIILSIRMRGF